MEQRLRSIEVLQSKALRIVLNKPYDCSRSELYSEKQLLLRVAAMYETIFLTFKIVHNKIHHSFKLIQARQVHEHHTRNAADFRLFKFRTQVGSQSILAKGLRLFNELPTELKRDMSLSGFKNLLKTHIWNTNTYKYYDQPNE